MRIHTGFAQLDFNSIKKIVKLLHHVFPTSMHSTEKYVWKHVLNPQGPSIISYAENDNDIIAFRAFWRFDFSLNGKAYIGYQPCDTATHPSYRGQGLFSRLTQNTLEAAENTTGVDIIFNFPNKNSKPGYLKMGWRQLGQLNRYVYVYNLKEVALRLLFAKETKKILSYKPNQGLELTNKFQISLEKNKIIPNLASEVISWRTLENPIYKYGSIDNKDIKIIYRCRNRQSFKEVEIVYLGQGQSATKFTSIIKKIAKDENAAIVTMIRDSSSYLLPGCFIRLPNNINFFGKIFNKDLVGMPLVFQPLIIDTV